MESTSSKPNAEYDHKQQHNSKNTTSSNPKKRKYSERKNSSIFRKLFGRAAQQSESSGCSGGNQKRGTLKDFFKKKQVTENATSEFKLLHLQTISSSRTLRQEDTESQVRPFYLPDHNSTQASSHDIITKSKPISRDQETTKLFTNGDLIPQVSRSINADIGRENTANNSIATQQSLLVVHQETETALFRKFYQDSGMQSEQSRAASEETIMPKSSSHSDRMEEEEEETSVLSPSSSAVLAPKNSKSNVKTPEAGDKATPRIEKAGESDRQMPTSSVDEITFQNDALTQRNEQALVPYDEDTLRILLYARSKLLAYLEKDDPAINKKLEIPDDSLVEKTPKTEEVSDLMSDEDAEEMRRARCELLRKKIIDDAKTDTYKNMQSDIKEMITDLLLQSSEIKGEALSAGVLEDDSPPLICDFLDTYYSSASADVAYVLNCILDRVDEKLQKPVGIGDADDVRSTLRQFLMPTGQKNVAETYFCTTSFDRIPKTSWVFGGNRKKSKFLPKRHKKDIIDDDVLLQSLEGCCDLLSGLFDNKGQEYVCMVPNGGMKKSDKSINLPSQVGEGRNKSENRTRITESRIIANTDDEEVLSSSSCSSRNFDSFHQNTHLPLKKVVSSSSDDSAAVQPIKHSKKTVLVKKARKVEEFSGYDSDVETGLEEQQMSSRDRTAVLKKSKQEFNSPDEIKKIEDNVAANERLERRRCLVLNKPVEYYDAETPSDEDTYAFIDEDCE